MEKGTWQHKLLVGTGYVIGLALVFYGLVGGIFHGDFVSGPPPVIIGAWLISLAWRGRGPRKLEA